MDENVAKGNADSTRSVMEPADLRNAITRDKLFAGVIVLCKILADTCDGQS